MARLLPAFHMKKQGADWLGWSMQFVAGLVVGSIVGALLYPGGVLRIHLLSREAWPEFMLGIMLFGAGLASHYGDVLWIGGGYRVVPPDEMQHSIVSRRISFFVGACGAIRMLMAFAHTFHVPLGF